jgi:hypothetical protein
MQTHVYKWLTLVLARISAFAVLFVICSVETAYGQTTLTIWPASAAPVVVDGGPDNAVEVGVKFRADVSGFIRGIRFYKASTNTGTHVGNLWTRTGTRLATATFTGETASGWQQVNFSNQVAITANTVYVASYHTNVGHYSGDENYFAGRGMDSPPLHALANGVSGVNGVYAYGATSRFPNQGWRSSNYWVDVVFTTGGQSDTVLPTVTSFVIPSTSATLIVPITSFVATDNVGVTGYIITQSSVTPSATGSGWSTSAPTSYTFSTPGSKTLFAWAKDAANNVSVSQSASVTITLADATPPTVTAFTMPATSATLAVPITSFTATDNVAVTGYILTESATAPSAAGSGWSATAPSSHTFATAGTKTLYSWAKDAAGNVSTSRNASVTITIPPTGPEVTGWYAGDMHVHRSCGGSPESVAGLPSKMATENLAVISLLADMGNGEVQNPATDLPQVNGQDASVSTPGRIVHWDTEWHWDAIYTQFPHQALGGHLVALGLTQAQQVWEEYTYPVLEWAHQRNAIAGFVHMQYLDGGIPQSLTCCTPIEYPVEVALGAADFISEDVDDSGSGFSMNPENAIQAYYKLLNTGFRPGLTAGTDYPCNGSRPLGSLLTYVQVANGQMTYRNWIDGIKNGRTVISRNGHREFLNLTVNGSATPGDEITLSAGASLPVTVQWTATANLSGTIELVSNGVVVATQQASAGPGAPVSLNATVNFPKSGWVAARRMGADGHQVHTAAVFVKVDGKPVRASAADAQFFVQWMDNLLAKTSPGGPWVQYFPTKLAQARARYQAAKAVYQQIAVEAGADPPDPPGPGGPSIFTTQTPSMFENDSAYELGTKFWSDVNGQITQVRLYTHALEGGNHSVRIWQVNGSTLVAGPFTWNILSGTEGWKTFTLPSPVAITANTDYIVAISNSSDHHYAEQPQGLAAPIVSGHLHTYVGSGVYSTALGTMPTSTWQNTNYFRDIVFAPQ